METLITVFLSWGLYGLIAAAFTESIFSPILADVVLIPLAIAKPEYAIYYGVVATVASVIGGFIGYGLGYKIGLPAARKIIPSKYEEKIHKIAEHNVKWTLFLAAMSPVPYKLICITAGALRINFTVFVVMSFFGRAKRFLLEGILIYYYGPKAIYLYTQYSEYVLIGSLVFLIVGGVIIYSSKRMRKNTIVRSQGEGGSV